MNKQKHNLNKLSSFLSKWTYILIAISLVIGIGVGYAIAIKRIENSKKIGRSNIIQLLIHNGDKTQNWNTVSIKEGESILNITERVLKADNIDITLLGEGRNQTINTLMSKSSSDGEWKYYVNNANPLPPISKYFPKNNDVISLIYTKNSQ